GLVRLLTSAESAAVLIVASLLLAGLAGALRRRGQEEHALPMDVASVAATLVGLLIATAHGREMPLTAAAVHAGGVAGALLANRRWRNDVLPHAAGAVLIAGSLWALQGLCPGRREWWGLALAAEAFILAVADLVCERKVAIARAAHRTALFAGSLGLLLA